MDELSKALITLGLLLLIGLGADAVGRRTRLPRVTLLLVVGFVIGPSALDLLPHLGDNWFPTIAAMALVMVGFMLGEKFTLTELRQHGRLVLWISIAEVVVTALVTFIGLLLAGIQLEIALLLAGIAPATAPAATVDVVHEAKADGPFARTLLSIVAVDDAWGLIAFSVMLAIVQTLQGKGGGGEALLFGLWELGGAFLVGVILGLPVAYLADRVQPGALTLAKAVGAVFLCGGIAIWLEVSFLLAAMVLGTVVANLAHHHERPFHAIQDIQWPFMVLFFILAGAELHLESLSRIGLVGAAYILLRIIGRLLGGWLGGLCGGAAPLLRRWIGPALMPQAGVAMGMALVVSQRMPNLSDTILPVVIGATMVFEIIGPVLTRKALVHVGEVHIN